MFDLRVQKADFALGLLSVTAERLEATDFTQPYFHDPITFVLPMVYAFEEKLSLMEDSFKLTGKLLAIGFLLSAVVAWYLTRMFGKNFINGSWILVQSAMQKGKQGDNQVKL